jgi:hypothetical protein
MNAATPTARDSKLSRARAKATLSSARKDERRAYNRAIRRAGKAACRAAR